MQPVALGRGGGIAHVDKAIAVEIGIRVPATRRCAGSAVGEKRLKKLLFACLGMALAGSALGREVEVVSFDLSRAERVA